MDSVSLDTIVKVVGLAVTAATVVVTVVRTVWRAVGSIEALNRTMTSLAEKLGTLDSRFNLLEARQSKLEDKVRDHDVDLAVIKEKQE